MAKAEYRSAVRSRRLIKQAFADLLQEKPLDRITVTDVVQRAGINRGTFYAHYADIPDVIDHLIGEGFQVIREAIFERPMPLEQVPGVLLRSIQSYLDEDPELTRKVLNSSAAPIMQEKLVALVLDYMYRHEKEISHVSHERYVLLIRFCAGGLSELYTAWFAGELPLTPDQLTFYAEALLYSVIAGAAQLPDQNR